MEQKAFVAVCVALASVVSGVRVTTPFGPVDGGADDGFEYFKGIPYAEAPVGTNRFKAPQSKVPWTTPLDATEFGPGCPAHCVNTTYPKPSLMCAKKTSEDCLYLNVYRPAGAGGKKLPVVLFIPGGAFDSGSASAILYDGSNLAKTQQMIIVTINYRLGALGGLVSSTVGGNLQIRDQREAMRFVRRVIGSFGGDKDRVTLAGHSAGAASVAVHLISPMSFEYFSAAIMMSNPAGLPLPLKDMAKDLGDEFVKLVGCPQGGAGELSCLRSAPVDKLLKAQGEVLYLHRDELLLDAMKWAPVVDYIVVFAEPIELMESGQHHRVPILMSTVSNETMLFIDRAFSKPMKWYTYMALIELLFGIHEGTGAILTYGDIPKDEVNDARDFFSVIGTDYLFYCSSRYMAWMMSEASNVFVYFVDKVASWNKWVYGKSIPYCIDMACHGSDLAFVFNNFEIPNTVKDPPVPTAEEKELIKTVQSMWGNFVHNHDPGTLSDGVVMPEIQHHSHKNISSSVILGMGTHVDPMVGYRTKYCDYWDDYGYVQF